MTRVPSDTIEALSAVRGDRHVLTIGNFDGVHLGHRHVLKHVTSRAVERAVPSLVVTFEPHPIAVLRPEQAPPRLSTPDDKLLALHSQGIDKVAIIPFSLEFASLSPEEFLSILTEVTQPTDVYVGEGFRFGKMRAGDIETIQHFGAEHSFQAHSVSPFRDKHGVVSSSRIRSALLDGQVEQAADLLGRRYRLSGTVEHGMARGRDLGFPTANLQVPPGLCVPGDGIYVGYAHLDGPRNGTREAMIYVGTSPTFGDRERQVEVNILDYQGDLYSQSLEIEFVGYVRGDRRFETADDLMAQMAEDESQSRRILKACHPEPASKGV